MPALASLLQAQSPEAAAAGRVPHRWAVSTTELGLDEGSRCGMPTQTTRFRGSNALPPAPHSRIPLLRDVAESAAVVPVRPRLISDEGDRVNTRADPLNTVVDRGKASWVASQISSGFDIRYDTASSS